MKLSGITKISGLKGKAKRIGRGIGSGKGGHTVGRGHKGQNARKGHKFGLGFEGGQVPLYKRLPQLGGFRSFNAKDVVAVSLSAFNKLKDATEVTPKVLLEKRIIKRLPKNGVKVLANGTLKKKLTFKGFLFSQAAKTLVEKAGSKIND